LVSSYLLQGSLYYRPFLNITIIDIKLLSKADRQEYNLNVSNGLLVLEMGSTSPLKGKVAINEVITHIEGVKVNKSTDFSVELLKYAPNDTIELTVCNADGTNVRNVEITLIKR
jgi:S1-C subfamily serine protease